MDLSVKISLVEGCQLPFPSYQTDEAAGMDLMSNESLVLKPSERALVSCGFCMELPKGYEAQIRPRSGLAIKHGITLLNSPGTIDSDYRGEIKAIMIHHGKEDFKIEVGDRIAQMVISPITRSTWVKVQSMSDTVRGAGGFGHTGKS